VNSPGDATAVVAAGLTKRYRRLTAVDSVSFEILQGELFALLGPNGAGKTTTVEILEGYQKPDSGEATVLGLHPARQPKRLMSRIGVMLQEGGLYTGIRVGEAVKLFAGYYEASEDPKALIELLGLERVARSFVRTLSGGEKQRLSFALALVGKPELLFLDEPTAGMDPRGRAEVWEIIREIRDRGGTILLTTQLLGEAEQLADRVAIIHRGRIVATGKPGQMGAPPERLEFRTARPIDPQALSASLGGPEVIEAEPRRYAIEQAPSPGLVEQLAAWLLGQNVLLVEIRSTGESLEETFLRVTSE
jgi:ABC-2 type transport system ATP-binding protein